MDEPKTLMFYINSLEKGGAERVIVQLAERFAGAGYHCVLVSSYSAQSEYPLSAAVERISMERTKSTANRLKKNINRITALRTLLKCYKPAALISFMEEPNFRALLASKGLPVKTVVSVRNDPEREYGGRLGGIIGRRLMPTADGCVFQTERAREWFPPKLQKKSRVIMNQVSELFFAAKADGERHGIVTAGRLNAQKNQALLIRAYAEIAGRTEEELLIYGAGDRQGELEELISALGLTGRVKLMGLSANVAESIKNAKLFVLSSDYEGMPNALLEAMALGLPCISSDCPCGGPAAVIRDGENGLLFPVGDERALADKMLKVLTDGGLAERLAAGAKATADSFRPEKIFGEWQEYIECVIGDKS